VGEDREDGGEGIWITEKWRRRGLKFASPGMRVSFDHIFE